MKKNYSHTIAVLERKYNIINYAFVILLLIYSMSRIVIPVQFIGSNKGFMIFITVYGLLIGMYNIFIRNLYKRAEFVVFLILFLFFNLITLISVYSYGIIDNIKHTVVFFIYFFAIYSTYFLLPKGHAQKVYYFFVYLLVLIQTITAIISIIQFISLRGYYVLNFNGKLIRQGFVDSRLFGIFYDPNYAATISLIAIVFAIYNIKRSNILQIVYYLTIIVSNYAYIVLSGSRTTLISLIIVVAIYIYYKIKIYNSDFKKKMVNMVLIIFLVLTSYLAIKNIGEIYLANHKEEYLNNIVRISKEGESVNGVINSEVTLERSDVSDKNISNNRFAIWEGTIKLVSNKPLFGVSSGNWLGVSKSYDNSNYVVEQEYLPHNGYLDLLFYNGIVGFGVIAIFVLLSIKKILLRIVYIDSEDENIKLIFMLFTIILVLLTYCMFFSNLFYGLNIFGILFYSSIALGNIFLLKK